MSMVRVMYPEPCMIVYHEVNQAQAIYTGERGNETMTCAYA